ncbi:class I SAM-dependent methyltransferase [Mycobacterium sp. LTG2003]
MSEQDRARWDATYADRRAPVAEPALPPVFAAHESALPMAGSALDIACGPGLASVWLARRGLDVWGVDVSAVAIGHAEALAARYGVADRCRFDAVDLDGGLPAGPAVDVILCHRFRDRGLYRAMIERLTPAGVLAISVLSEVGGEPGRFRAAPGELLVAFGGLEVIDAGEGGGEAWLLARRPDPTTTR